MTMLSLGLAGFVLFCLCIQWGGIGLALSSLRRPVRANPNRPGITILRPVCGLEHQLDQTLTTTFHLDYPRYEILFCVAAASDPVVPLVQRLIAAHPGIPARLLVGDDRISGNPKLNNLVKGWAAAAHPFVLMADSNVLLPPDSLTRLLDQWTPDTGLVSSPPIGVQPVGLWARLECAFLNSFQARWQMAAARVGNGFAQGKMLFWQRAQLDTSGGLAALGRDMAEDVAATKVTRAAGRHVRLPARLFAQPIGPRNLTAVWNRQLRWARVRRLGFPALFLPEVLAGAAFPLLATVAITPMAALPLLVLWYGPEYLLARRDNWPRSPADIATWMLRDAMLPLLWAASWASSSFEWRGNVMTAANPTQKA